MSNQSFGEYLKSVRESKGISINALAAKSGVSNSQISRIETGNRGVPKPETIQKIANALDAPYQEMMLQAGYLSRDLAFELMAHDKIEPTPEMSELVKQYKINITELDIARRDRLSAEQNILDLNKSLLTRIEELRQFIKDTDDKIEAINATLELRKLEVQFNDFKEFVYGKKHTVGKAAELTPYNETSMLRLPVLGTIRAGEPIDRIEHNEGYTLVDPELLRGREGFALRVKGDSMSGDRILEGDLVIVLRQDEVEPSDIAIVAINGDEATLKRVKLHGDMVMLSPSNPAYEPQLLPAKDVSIIGKVVEVKFWPNKGGQ